MSALLNSVLLNLTAQRQAMVQDDLALVLQLIEEQEALAVKLKEYLSAHKELVDEDKALLMEIHELTQTNQLLAQQSLAFSRRMLRTLAGEDGYGEDGNINTPKSKNLRLDIRA